MTLSARKRKLPLLAVLGAAALAACAAPAAPDGTRTADRPATAHPTAGAPGRPAAEAVPPRHPGQAATPQAPPTMAPGPGGRTPVFERGSAVAGKTVALTFDADMTADQGPRAARGEHFDNPALIGALRELKVDATVFMTGRWAEEYPDQARAIGTDPRFEIANHSYSHYAFKDPCYGLPVLGRAEQVADVRRAFDAFRTAGARNVVPYFRFPGGCHDDRALTELAPARVTAVQWDVVSGDAFATDADAVAEQVLAGVRPGSLVVMHCTRSAAPVTERAVRKIVPALRAKGYRFVKVSELMRPEHGDER
ncbi:polysaccharide deacetylase family protein [Streptomyces sp. LP05-1]|uniref:Polysaccharide deacetylase family protein n=1 Tax=Streptomyces pyxinae TaxID=2970734 RepID=A0ABT2CDI7_9ACTN|nr:polysaccharide deacetylase family protein [Streptomyces sp. LP05-1]MCS0635488.1 polysaccharide deacetylase family protein [Streptomyces sp. LP05-1]